MGAFQKYRLGAPISPFAQPSLGPCLPVPWVSTRSLCSYPNIPVEVHDKVDGIVTFENLASNPDQYRDRTVELDGHILGSIAEHDEVHLLVRALPIRTASVCGPVDTGRLSGTFVIPFPGEIGAQDV